MKSLKTLSHNELRAYISVLEGVKRVNEKHNKRFLGLTDVFGQIASSVDAPLAEALAEQQRRIQGAFPDVGVNDRIEHRFPAPHHTSPAKIQGKVSPEGIVTRVGTISHFSYTGEGPVAFYYDDEKRLGIIVGAANYGTWRKVEV